MTTIYNSAAYLSTSSETFNFQRGHQELPQEHFLIDLKRITLGPTILSSNTQTNRFDVSELPGNVSHVFFNRNFATKSHQEQFFAPHKVVPIPPIPSTSELASKALSVLGVQLQELESSPSPIPTPTISSLNKKTTPPVLNQVQQIQEESKKKNSIREFFMRQCSCGCCCFD